MAKKENCPYKTAEELGLTQEQWEALIKAQSALERGQIQHLSVDQLDTGERAFYEKYGEEVEGGAQDRAVLGFNMNTWSTPVIAKGDCGSACCLGGTAELLAGKPLFSQGDYPDALDSLFHPNLPNWELMTPEQGAKALKHYLTTGDDGDHCWRIARGAV